MYNIRLFLPVVTRYIITTKNLRVRRVLPIPPNRDGARVREPGESYNAIKKNRLGAENSARHASAVNAVIKI